jgi:HK97 family phage major capsid protein
MAITDAGIYSASATAWTPTDYGRLVDTVLRDQAGAFRAATVIDTVRESIRLPMITADPSVAWMLENVQITASDPTLAELVVTPKAVKALTQISNEAVNDTTPAVAQQVGLSLARSVGKKVDSAFFGATVTNGPSGLLSLSSTAVDTAGVITAVANLDAFHDAKKVAEDHNAILTHWVISPAIAAVLGKAKTATDWNTALVPDLGDGTLIAGLPVIINRQVDAATLFWGIDQEQIFTVLRTGTTIAMSPHAAFDYDAVQVRVTARVDFGFANPAGVIRAYDVSP